MFLMLHVAMPDMVQCPDCLGHYDPTQYRGVVISGRLENRTVCRNCAELMGWHGCYACGREDGYACGDEYLCVFCADNEGWAICDHCANGFDPDELIRCGNHDYCEDCCGDNGYAPCYSCGNYHHVNDMDVAYGDSYCRECFYDRYSYCAGCREVFCNDDMHWHDDECYCSDCMPCNSEYDFRRFRGSDNYTKMPSRRKFGIELETSECPDSDEFEGGPWGAKHDGSISGLEFYSDILYGDAGLDAIDSICAFAERRCWDVDMNCGYHAHFDMRGESNDSLKSIAGAYLLTYDVWSRFVDSDRLANSFCRRGNASISDIAGFPEFYEFSGRQSRYTWINFSAYNRHKTFELRLHEGTLDACAIKNWVKAHAIFMDWASCAGWAQVRNTLLCMNTAEKFEFIAQLWAVAGCDDLGDYYGEKAGLLCLV